MSDVRPRLTITVLAVLALVQVYRIAAFSEAQAVLAGASSPAWLHPALGDVVMGITAPFIALALWRRAGFAVWVSAIVWFSLSFWDYTGGMTAALYVGPASIAEGTMTQSAVVTWFAGWLVIDVIALVLLARNTTRSYYVRSRAA